MRKKRDKFCTKSIMLLLGTVILLMIAGFVVPTHAASADISPKRRLETTNVMSAFDPFLLQRITFLPQVVPTSVRRFARAPRIPVNSGNNNGIRARHVFVPIRLPLRSLSIPYIVPLGK